MTRLRLTVEYEGTAFAGWQLQTDDRTVQGALEEALRRVTSLQCRIHGAGRTDAGVHALGQVCHVDCETRLSCEELRRALNAVLPGDVAVLEVAQVPAGFDARRDVLRKRYLYRVLHRVAPSPLRRHVAWHVRPPLDLARMRRAAELLVGERDFEAFRGAPGGGPPPRVAVRKLERLDVLEEGDEVHFVLEARSFQRHMVRNLVGTLVEVGRGSRDPESIPALLASRDRARAGPTAPPQGLCLVWVLYPEGQGG